ncbi:MAG: nitrogen fixation protein NifZ [Azoarcus sp.]|nr:nitrogen fixation protein NifZ [Azoarcus sp.]
MSTLSCKPGEVVYAADAIYNDGSLPEVEEGALLAAPGTRGVVVKTGHVEAAPEVEIFVVRFEGPDAVLGPPVGCFADELTQAVTEVASH